MKVHKTNTHAYESLYDSLVEDMHYSHSRERGGVALRKYKAESEKITQLFHTITAFEKKIETAANINETAFCFYSILSQIVPLKESGIFLFDENRTELRQIDDYPSKIAANFVNRAFKEGMLDWVFKSGKLTIIPLTQKKDNVKIDLNCIAIPLKYKQGHEGILLIFTDLTSIKNHIWEFKAIEILLTLAMRKIETLKLKKNLKSAYQEMQTYQSKLSNDFRLSAIGELTSGIVEHIFSPLQVIMTSADLIQIENPDTDDNVIKNIKEQIAKVKNMLDPLVKFAETKNYKPELQPCSLNELIENYHKIIQSSMVQKNYECILDLEEEIPSIVTDSSAITQLLTNIFTLLKSETQNSGGILIQTKHQDDYVNMRVISTDYIPVLECFENNPTKDLSILMIKNIMKKHSGKVHMETSNYKGSSISLIFPLKRALA